MPKIQPWQPLKKSANFYTVSQHAVQTTDTPAFFEKTPVFYGQRYTCINKLDLPILDGACSQRYTCINKLDLRILDGACS